MLSPAKHLIQDGFRLREITSVLTKHGFVAVVKSAGLGRFLPGQGLSEVSEFEDGKPGGLITDTNDAAIRFRKVLEDLGPTFVKLGQILSTRPDILPASFMEELKLLQDRVPPMSFEIVRRIVEESLNGKIEDFYDDFREQALAAASIGQVHRAKLKSGEEVVVKVQRDGIKGTIRSDLDILYYIAKLLEVTIEEFELYTPTAIVKEFEKALLSELDFTLEASNIDEFKRNFEDIDYATAPVVYHELTTERVMTMEFIDAIKLSNIESASERAKAVLPHLLDSMVKMVMSDGFFHGDPHPGNILVREDNSLVFIDFGLVGRLSGRQQDELILLIVSIISGDIEGISRALLRMGRPVGRVQMREFKADITRIRDEYLLANLTDINVTKFVQECTDAANHHRIRLNPNYAILTKAAATIEGIMRDLDPELDIMAVGVPYARQLARDRFTTKKIAQGAMTAAMGLSGFLTQVPQQLDQVLMDLEGGNLELRVRNDAMEDIGKHLNTLGTRLFLGIIASGLAICAAILLQAVEYAIYGIPVTLIVALACVGIALTFFWWALTWHIVGGARSTKLRLSPIMRLLRKE